MITNPTDDSLASPSLGAPSLITNPHLAALDRSYSALPDDTKDVINRAHEILGLRGPQSAAAVQAAAAQPAGAPEGQQPIAPPISRISGPEENPMPGMVGVTPGMTAPAAQPLPGRSAAPSSAVPPMSRFTSPAEDTLSSAQTKGNGIQQIQSPWARVPLQILDAIGSGLFPRLAAGIPGTQAHHQQVVSGLENQVGQEQKEQAASDVSNKSAASTAAEGATAEHTKAETGAIPSTIAHTQAQTEAILHPQPKEELEGKTIETDQGIMQWNPATKRYDVPAGNAPGKETANVHVLPDGTVISVNHNAKTGQSTAEVVYKGDPKEGTPRIVQLERGGKPHQVLVRPDGTEIKDLGETGEKPPTVNVNAGTSALDRETSRFAKPHEKAVADANSQLEKIADARAMINGSAEAQALGIPKVLTALVSGAGSGVRITQPELNAIGAARGISGDVEGFINSVSGKGKLTSTQQSQLTSLLDGVKDRIEQKQALANEALDNINGASSRDEIIRHDKEARQKLTDLEKSQHPANNQQTEPARPKGVPVEAKWNPASRHWEAP